ncbi:DUF4114 domain-containing protein [Pyxidicoccus fallax]|uniref:DUF4114 domain-containing protein n=1 Tax=Pyxidicoccus fallax TaxID=394095 RepID=A0A848L8M8_9BACT|nr:fibrinogen-like YCDxxxxGGGW domain-containing protein [Pyxidicoccus fallax]NMO14954.1 DUF4114 domain-containing protein [Pyxidicoccus fallax]NPC84223.1 DUF4114 domain-containing protein [Pyxidicoccus fallax]
MTALPCPPLTRVLASLCLLTAAGCEQQAETPQETGALGRHRGAVSVDTPEVLPAAFLQDIANALPEDQSVPLHHPDFVAPTFDPNVLVTATSEVWVTFISEGATFLNTLGYFTYPDGSPPTSTAAIEKHVIFENASAWGSGGGLQTGDRMYLGQFPAGTRIGFFLVSNGWNWTEVDFSRPTYYTLDALNPESNASKRRHIVSLFHLGEQRRVLSFEDSDRMHEQTNDDFNDIIFTLSSTPSTGTDSSGPSIPAKPCPEAPSAAPQSCRQLQQFCPSLGSGLYTLDPCGTGASQHYCDMTSEGGGWTVAGWQPASAKTSLGLANRGTVGSDNWSRSLACVQYTQIRVFNRTYGEGFSATYPASTWNHTSTNMSIGTAGTAFKQGTYGPASSQIMMGCVNYSYNGGTSVGSACDSDWQPTARGHLADYAGEYCAGGRLDYTWAWSNGSMCQYRGVPYTWGFAIR